MNIYGVSPKSRVYTGRKQMWKYWNYLELFQSHNFIKPSTLQQSDPCTNILSAFVLPSGNYMKVATNTQKKK